MADESQVASPEAEIPVVPVVPETPGEPAVEPEPKTYTQDDLDRIVNKVKKNARYQTRKEVEAFYQGRDSRPEPKPVAPEDRPPERGDFPSYEEYIDAKAVYAGGKSASEHIARERNESMAREAADASAKTLNDFQSKAKEKYPDLEDRLDAISDIEMPSGVLQSITESSLGPDILSHLADNPKECQRIAALSPLAAIREIGKLESKLEAKPEPKKINSKAPAPINPGGGGSPVDDTPQDTDDINDWMRKEHAQERKRAGAG